MAFTSFRIKRIVIAASFCAAITACGTGDRRVTGGPTTTTAVVTPHRTMTRVAPTTVSSPPVTQAPTTTIKLVTPTTFPYRHVVRCQVEPLIREIWQTDVEWALRIAWRESRCVPSARNPSGSSGIFQLQLPLHNDLLRAAGCTPADWDIPSCNIRAAWLLYQGAGRRPWHL